MAGRRQHFLPQFLLKGFSSKEKGGSVFTWVCRKGGKLFEPNIQNVGVAKDFYDLDTAEIDDRITRLEPQLAVILDKLRLETRSRRLVNDRIPELVTHFSIRTRHLRMAVFEAGDFLMQLLLEHLEKPENLEELARAYLRRNPQLVKEIFFKEFEKQGIPRRQTKIFWKQQRHLFERLAKARLGEIGIMAPLIGLLKGKMTEALKKAAQDGHLKALAGAIIPEPRLRVMRSLSWRLIILQDDLILGDMGVLTSVGHEGRFRSLPEKGDPINSVYLPISTGHLVFGSSNADSPPLATKSLNRALAQHSHQFIVGGRKDLVAEYGAEIDTKGPIFSVQELAALINEVLDENLIFEKQASTANSEDFPGPEGDGRADEGNSNGCLVPMICRRAGPRGSGNRSAGRTRPSVTSPPQNKTA
ncbi:MAG TPA: DUF4238 domain-containing protein [Acidobacteriota bacterium]|nr:DUF4238 domain-containing protein [Acidobacteriota bacterium]